MTASSLFCVLDVETSISEMAASLAAPGRQPGIARAALHELVGGSVLTFERDVDGRFGSFSHLRVGEAGEEEVAMLRALDAALRPVHDAGGSLVTFNGAHDMSVLRRRVGRHWLFELLALPDWPSEPAGRHVDLMRLDRGSAGGRWPSLVDAAAGFGFSAVCPRPTARSATVSMAVRKAEVDVAATTLLLFHHLAFEERSLGPLAQGWAALSEWIVRDRRLEDHLRPFARHPFSSLARGIARGGRPLPPGDGRAAAAF